MSTLTIDRVFSNAASNPYDEVTWSKRTVVINDDNGKPLFEQKDVEAPASWSDLAVKIVASKYFYGTHGTPERENSVRKLIHRVARTIADWGIESGYFSAEDGEVFYQELSALCVNQYGVFNSPVWFNVGLWHQYKAGINGTSGGWAYNYETGQVEKQTLPYLRPQGSACFIQSVDDNMDSLMALAASEAMLFKFGSGTGTDLSTIRSSKERLSGGGRPSGPMSFLKVYDQVANTIKSGGKTRRAAKMNTLRDWHPDIEEFIVAKMKEEKKAHALIDAGYDGSFNGEAYGTVAYQNENLSVRVSDEFMNAAINGDKWPTRAVTTGQVVEEKDASKLLDQIAEGTWVCGDPGLQYDGAIQRWHTCKGTEPIHSTNPCSEYIFLNNTACNLASLNLMKFRTEDGQFDITKFKAAARIFIIAQEILVDSASYPTKLIAENSHIFRTLGLGYANLGSLIMSYGLPYDSKEGNTMAGSLAALMTGVAYTTSAEIASVKGPFSGYNDARCSHIQKPLAPSNKESMLEVIRAHSAAADKLDSSLQLPANLSDVIAEAKSSWKSAYQEGLNHGYRNAQVTVVAPTGTIAFMMDCDTTGIEPDIALVKYKTLAGGGHLKIVNNTVPAALKQLGYSEADITRIAEYIFKHDTIEDVEGETSGLLIEHLPIFDCAFKAAKGKRSIPWMAHLNVMAAVQPFISGAISKTVNMPGNATANDIRNAYIEAWKLGLKCVAIYRDGSKRSQPLNTSSNADTADTSALKALEAKVAQLESALRQVTNKGGPYRERLQDTREALTHKFNISGQEGYATVGLYDDGRPGELFIQMAKEGSTMGGLMDAIGTLTSISLQYGVPLQTLVDKFSHQRFEPHGYTSNPKIRTASSIIDYIFRWMESEFPDNGKREKTFDVSSGSVQKPASVTMVEGATKSVSPSTYKSGQCCTTCGSSNVQISGTCATCTNCGTSLGCS